jgi:hypothetical protein
MSFSLSVFNPHPVSCKQTENQKIYINITNILQSPKYHATKAIRIREQDIVNAILEHQYCNVHAGNQFDRTPLYYAALDAKKLININ